MRQILTIVVSAIAGVSVFASTSQNEKLGQLVTEYAVKGNKKQWQVDQFGKKTVYKYDKMGQLVETRVDGQKDMEYRYYKNGRLGATRDKLGRITKKKYDINGRITKKTDALELVSKFNYDKFGRLIDRTGAGAYPLQYQYTPFSEISSYTDKNGATNKFEYNEGGRISKRIWPDGSEINYTYNKQGKLAVKKEAGRVTSYQYDDMLRLTQVKIVHGEESLTTNRVYNEAGHITAISDGSTTVRFSYDRFGRKLLEEGPVGTFKYMYNERGLLSMRQYEFKDSKDKFITSYIYDKYNRIVKIESPAGTYKYTWSKSNKIKAIEFGNGQKIVYAYDKANRLVSKKLGDMILVSYKYDALDRRITASYMGVDWKYAYDKYNQLIKAESSLKQKYNYEYDAIGNRTHVYSDLIASAKTFDYNFFNQISSKGYSYDQWGNLIQSPDAKYKYDLRNRLIEVVKGDKNIKYTYDALDQRISAVQNGKRTNYLMSSMVEYARKSDAKTQYHTLGLDIAGSLDKTGAVGAVLASSDASGKGFNYLYDGNGNVVANCSINGDIISKLSYSPFGKQLSGEKLPFSFSSKVADSSDLSYYGYRFYDSIAGKWTNRDIIEELGAINLYGFVNNNAISNYDVRGMLTFTACATAYIPGSSQEVLDKIQDCMGKTGTALTNCLTNAGVTVGVGTVINIICCTSQANKTDPCATVTNATQCQDCCNFKYCTDSISKPSKTIANTRAKQICSAKCLCDYP